MCCPIPIQPGRPVARQYFSCRKYNLFARLPLANSSFCWIVGSCGVLFAVAFHGLPTHKFKNCKPQTLTPSRRHIQRVSIAPVGVNNRNSSVRSSLPTKTPRIHLKFNSTPSSEWFRPKHTFPNEDYDVAFSDVLSLENCLQPMHCAQSSSPSAVQFLSCLSIRRLHEMLDAVDEALRMPQKSTA